MKRIEFIKSIVLAFLIGLSIVLTFSIWTYTPKYDFIEQPPTVDVSIAEKQNLGEVIKPYKLLYHFEDGYKGTTVTEEIDTLIESMKSWTITDLTLEDQSYENEKLVSFMRQPNQFTLFFQGDVPLPVFDNILNLDHTNIPEVSFDRLVVDWSSSSSMINMSFISQRNNWKYRAKVRVPDSNHFYKSLITKTKDYMEYKEVAMSSQHFLAVPAMPIELIRNTYYHEETSPGKFRDGLFNDPNAVRRSQIGSNLEEYQDDHALMTVDTAMKTLSFVHPVVESKEMAIPSELLLNTIDFVNEHGGWTDEYRYSYMNPLQRRVKFQLYIHGIPVWSDSTITSTEIEQVWGEDRIFKYTRPYYTLNLTLPSETDIAELPSGTDVVEAISKIDLIDVNDIEEIMPAYYMMHEEDNSRLFILEPSWYYSLNGNWIRFSPKQLEGGGSSGLE